MRARASLWLLLVASVYGAAAYGASAPEGMKGDWATPGGSVVRVEACADALCMTVVRLGPTAEGTVDKLNPDPALRSRPLCGLRIGVGFTGDSEKTASGGKVYDPESGKTYNGKLALDGDRLKLRGFIGVSLFGRTETWQRTPTIQACK